MGGSAVSHACRRVEQRLEKDPKLRRIVEAGRLRHIAGSRWGTRERMNMGRLKRFKQEQQEAAAGTPDNAQPREGGREAGVGSSSID